MSTRKLSGIRKKKKEKATFDFLRFFQPPPPCSSDKPLPLSLFPSKSEYLHPPLSPLLSPLLNSISPFNNITIETYLRWRQNSLLFNCPNSPLLPHTPFLFSMAPAFPSLRLGSSPVPTPPPPPPPPAPCSAAELARIGSWHRERERDGGRETCFSFFYIFFPFSGYARVRVWSTSKKKKKTFSLFFSFSRSLAFLHAHAPCRRLPTSAVA